MKNLRVVFMGTPSFAVPTLEYLIKNCNVDLVVCQPDKEKDRKKNIVFPPIKQLAIKNNIEVFQPQKIKEEYNYILNKKPDIIITCAYGQIIPDIILNYPKYGCINIHGSLLPLLRGGAPIHHAIIKGMKKTGITIMYMASKMDAGDIISQKEIEIKYNDTLDTLYEKMSILGRDLLIETLPNIINNSIEPIKQDEEKVTYGYNITKDMEHIDFNQTSRDIYNLVRGLNSNPGAFFNMDNIRVKVYEVEVLDNVYENKKVGQIVEINKLGFIVKTKDSSILVKDIKIEGKKRIKVSDYLNGIQDKNILLDKILN